MCPGTAATSARPGAFPAARAGIRGNAARRAPTILAAAVCQHVVMLVVRANAGGGGGRSHHAASPARHPDADGLVVLRRCAVLSHCWYLMGVSLQQLRALRRLHSAGERTLAPIIPPPLIAPFSLRRAWAASCVRYMLALRHYLLRKYWRDRARFFFTR